MPRGFDESAVAGGSAAAGEDGARKVARAVRPDGDSAAIAGGDGVSEYISI